MSEVLASPCSTNKNKPKLNPHSGSNPFSFNEILNNKYFGRSYINHCHNLMKWNCCERSLEIIPLIIELQKHPANMTNVFSVIKILAGLVCCS